MEIKSEYSLWEFAEFTKRFLMEHLCSIKNFILSRTLEERSAVKRMQLGATMAIPRYGRNHG